MSETREEVKIKKENNKKLCKEQIRLCVLRCLRILYQLHCLTKIN
jgi:hypothetical protein